MSPLTSVSVFLGVQLKMRDAFENEGVRPENQEMFVAILTHLWKPFRTHTGDG